MGEDSLMKTGVSVEWMAIYIYIYFPQRKVSEFNLIILLNVGLQKHLVFLGTRLHNIQAMNSIEMAFSSLYAMCTYVARCT